ncbi:MAG: HAMP domain-containing histidine kinase [Bacteroidetes bacterium]|nr:HAMP domain-containing histidine kinase [Bacteroidota bacterium]
MKQIFNIIKIVSALIALAFVILISNIVPKNQFEPYKLELDSVWVKEEAQQEYWTDINNDPKIEKIKHHNINIHGHSIEQWKGKKLNQVFIFRENEKFAGKNLTFADVDSNRTKELLFVSFKNNSAFLNILSYDIEMKILLPVEKIFIDSIKCYKNEIDVKNNFIITSGFNVFLDLQCGYSVQPRNIYKYDFKHKKLIKNKLNSFVNPKVRHLSFKKNNFLLATYSKATGNTISHSEAEWLRNSTNSDTLAMYKEVKHLEYSYGDFSSYILLYNDSLDFEFQPIEFFGWTNFTKAVLVSTDSIPHIVAFTNAQLNEPDNQRCKLLTVCNLKGEIIKQIPLPHNYTDIFSVNNDVIFYGDKTLYVNNKNLELLQKIKCITHAVGFIDINKDNKPEFVAHQNNVLKVFSGDFDINATFKIEQEFTPYPEEHGITTLQINNKNCLLYNTRLFYYLFSYQKNNIAFLKYPFYIFVFLFTFGFLFLISLINTRRLEKENLKLEQIVTQRTKEIAMQKEEIQTQAEELQIKNTNLIDLDKFKKLMTDTVIHSLKNPLNHIIGTTNDKAIRQSGYNMLNIILNILDINKAQTTNLNVNLNKQDVDDLIDSAILQVKYLTEQKNLSFEKIARGKFTVKADKNLTIRILVNLLTNAIKFSPLNSKITIQVKENKQSVRIDVIDYGKGISPENIDIIFNEYSQIEAKKSGEIQSTGLGLTFCKIASEAQNAKIDVCSVPGEKTRFSLILPLISSSEKKTESKQKNQIKNFLTEEERKNLQQVLQKLKQTEIFQATEILNLLNTVEDTSENIKHWKEKIKIAMYAMNRKLFKSIIDNEL